MVVGYVFSRNSNEEFEIIKSSPPLNNDIFYKKLYLILKSDLFNLGV